ncbi:helix-turn-helix transcriptional regulator [Chryseobacterium gwangjuense]|uniref:helix-turn-helix transcriptional regulator n=1 Tax=Chryseobacterium gwangjuense TaxID=1069980 RepID=UPI001E3D15A2|nr:helix-turn-helix transcriptional regulator [Chryseobacterium gwangjuense]MCE3076297.1 helix-turn-helix transcriptional regulator [Chryseobacterium gwangjuense]
MDEFFTIIRLGPEDAEIIKNSPNDPHRHDYEELIIGKEGKLEHFIDFNSKLFESPFISFVTKGKMHRARPLSKDGKCDIWALRFKTEFIPETTFQLYASFHENASLSMKDDACFDRLNLICNMIYAEYKQTQPDLCIIRQLLSTILTMVESERRKIKSDVQEYRTVQSTTFRNFLTLLEEHYKEPEGVNFYAEKLFMTVRNLNLICQNILYKSVSEIIETRKLVEAKNLLITTDLTVSEIGYELGFKEKTYFTHVFKKKAGITPTEFRQEMSKIIS